MPEASTPARALPGSYSSAPPLNVSVSSSRTARPGLSLTQAADLPSSFDRFDVECRPQASVGAPRLLVSRHLFTLLLPDCCLRVLKCSLRPLIFIYTIVIRLRFHLVFHQTHASFVVLTRSFDFSPSITSAELLTATMMHWLQDDNGKSSIYELQLDIVGFLAILGEGSVLANAQVSTLSKCIFLPRLLPAPQALMRPTRPTKLEPVPGHISGIHSGNYRDSINHIGNIVW